MNTFHYLFLLKSSKSDAQLHITQESSGCTVDTTLLTLDLDHHITHK